MFVLRQHLVADIAGVTIEDIQQDYIFSSRNYVNKTFDYRGEIHPITKAINDLVEYLGFNPFNYFKFYTTNTSAKWSELNAKLLSEYNRSNINCEYLEFDTNNNRFNNLRDSNGLNAPNATEPCPGGLASYQITGSQNYLNAMYLLVNNDGAGALQLSFYVIPQQAYTDGDFDNLWFDKCSRVLVQIFFSGGNYGSVIYEMNITVEGNKNLANILTFLSNSIWDSLIPDPSDLENPYIVAGESITGGGDGSGTDAGVDEVVKVEFPDLPDIDSVTTGLLTIFNPSLSQVNALGGYLWSNAFDVDTLKKLFGDPMDAIIGLSIVPVKPPLAGSKTVKIGNVSTDVSMPYCLRQFVEKNIGSIAIKKYVGSFMDYAPYTKIQIYLPYIGVRDLNPDDVMGETITVKYHIDILTGGCAAMISVGSKGVMYQYNGSCIANVPLTAINYSGAIQNAVSAIGSGITAVVGMATGAAPLTGVGVAGLATSAANTALTSKPSIQRSGSMGGSAGLMSVQQCYLIVTRPRMSVPKNLNKFGGYPANINAKLSTLTGLTMIDSIRLDNIPAMETEKQELLSLLQKGVIF